jgi:ectoine utilization protein EutC
LNVLLLNEHEIRQCVSMTRQAADAVAKGFARLSEGRVSMPPVVRVDIPSHRGEVDIKTAYIEGLDHFAIKVASGFFDNATVGLPYGSGMMLLMSARTGLLEAVLLDNGYLTDLRTGIAGAIAARYLAPQRIDTAGVIGSGIQARYQLRGLRLAREFRRVLVHARNPAAASRYADEMRRELGVEVAVSASIEDLVRQSQLVVTTTPTREPYLRAEWLHPGLHVTAVGADGEHKQELHADVFARADRIACDSRRQCFKLGELHHAVDAGIVRPDGDVVELGELIGGSQRGRASDDEITICDLTGVGVQDTTIAVQTFQTVQELKLGTSFET